MTVGDPRESRTRTARIKWSPVICDLAESREAQDADNIELTSGDAYSPGPSPKPLQSRSVETNVVLFFLGPAVVGAHIQSMPLLFLLPAKTGNPMRTEFGYLLYGSLERQYSLRIPS